jgi:hypothetical protein
MEFAKMELPVKEASTALANSDNHAQAYFLNNLSTEMMRICRSGFETQLCYIVTELDAHGKSLITTLAELISENDKRNATKGN